MEYTFTIDPAADLIEVARRLGESGVVVKEILNHLHIVTAEGSDEAFAEAINIPGVLRGEDATRFEIDPREVPDMGPTWPSNSERSVIPPATGSSWRSPAWDDEKR